MDNFGRTEKAILLVALAFLLAASYFLYDDSFLFPVPSISKNELIGDVNSAKNDVRRKNSDAFSWFPASQQDSVYQRDSIFTGDRSTAAIRLKDGSVIEVQPNSLITLNIRDGQMVLDLRYGNLVGDITKNSSLVIKSGNEEVKLQGDRSKLEFKKSRTGGMGVKLLAGNASAQSKSGQNIAKPEEKPEVVLDTPTGTNIVKNKPSDPVNLKWRSRGKISKFELEIAKDDQFTYIISNENTTQKQLSFKKELLPGTYSWRVKAYDQAGKIVKTTAANTFTITKQEPPVITSPLTASVLSLELPATKGSAPLLSSAKITWTADANLQKFNFQLAHDPDFKDLIKNVSTPLKESLSTPLPSGTYYARVQGQVSEPKADSPRLTDWSPTISFSLQLTAKKEVILNPPVLVTKKIQFRASPKDDRSPAAVAASPIIAWKPVREATAYRLQIAQGKNFRAATDYDVKDTKAAWTQYRPGNYYFRVYSVGAGGERSFPSTVGQMAIQTATPVLAPIAPVRKRGLKGQMSGAPAESVPVVWSPVAYAKSYLVEMDASDRFASPQKLSFNTTGGTLPAVPPGNYNVRVQALGENSQAISEFSTPQKLTYDYVTNTLATPSLSEPLDKVSIFMQKQVEPNIWLEWRPVGGAKTYRIEISAQPNFAQTLFSKLTNDRRFLIKEQVPTGKLYWRVRAESNDQTLESDWSAQREFIIYQQKNETFVK